MCNNGDSGTYGRKEVYRDEVLLLISLLIHPDFLILFFKNDYLWLSCKHEEPTGRNRSWSLGRAIGKEDCRYYTDNYLSYYSFCGFCSLGYSWIIFT